MSVTRDTVGATGFLLAILPLPVAASHLLYQIVAILHDCFLELGSALFGWLSDHLSVPGLGVNARTVSDVKLLNNIFSDGPKEYKDVDVSTLRLGYPVNFWRDVGDEVCLQVSKCPLQSAELRK